MFFNPVLIYLSEKHFTTKKKKKRKIWHISNLTNKLFLVHVLVVTTLTKLKIQKQV